MITNTIKAQYGGPPLSSLGYSKSYSKKIEGLLMSTGYQPSKLQQFDRRIAHFVENCSSVSTHSDLLFQQFVCSLIETSLIGI